MAIETIKEKRTPRAFPRGGEKSTQARSLISPIELRNNPVVRVGYSIALVICILLALVVLFPLYWLFSGGFKSLLELLQSPPTFWPVHPQWTNYVIAWLSVDWVGAFRNTLILALGSWLLSTFVSATAAYAFSLLRPKFGNVILFLFMCTLMIPGVVLVIPQYANILDVPLVHWNLIGTPFAIWFPGAFSAWSIFIYKLFFDGVPRDLVDAARLDGAGHWTIFRRICLPLIRPAIVVGLIFSFISDWSSFFWPMLTLTNSNWEPVGLVLYTTVRLEPRPIQIASSAIVTIVPFILVAIFQNQIIKSNAAFAGIKG
ncbi:ABC transporter permease [Ktedonobacteria bacterium brp13]|nr:ABC transporter permease [Ktedonobacteria bacterium brp13]